MFATTSNTANNNSNNNNSSYFDTTMTTTTNNTSSSSPNDMLTTTTQPHSNHFYHSNNNPPSLTTSSTNTTTTASGHPSPSSLPPTYATLPRTTKLEEEPNPFEQSFSKPVLPPVSSIESPGLHKTTLWDSLRAGPLSPSMLLGPAGNKQRTSTSSSLSSTSSISSTSSSAGEGIIASYHHSNTGFVKYNNHHQQTVTVNRAQHQSPSVKRTHTEPTLESIHLRHQNGDNDADDYDNVFERPNIKRRAQSNTTASISNTLMDGEEKRKNFLERNRLAALKCRQRKKQWLQNLQDKVEYLSTDNEQLQMQNNALREQLIELKSMLLVHKTCPVNSEAVIDAVNRPIPGSNNIIRHHQQQQQQQYHHSTSSIHFSSNASHRFSSYSRN
ncbi:hypothetical protein INT45_010518 [Circinella minor]|uniref:BZIP domain-containing protein n=1 Tax=Circinella minor TaxID=1195481 RepID=A0A8H7VMK1_9FUNG|nr:hypothetical protein INT45_010518 [Circinella minor]